MPLPKLFPTGDKSPLTLNSYTVDASGKVELGMKPGDYYELRVNPAEFTHQRSISYNTKRVQGQVGALARFHANDPDTISFAVVFDATGVVSDSLLFGTRSVPEQIADLGKVIYKINGEAHEPNHVRLLWGTTIFFGRLKSISTKYTLFKPSGEPLRAKSDLSFVGSISMKQAQLEAALNSPDLSHSVEVRDGDTLPLLCKRIYGDSRYYAAVARFNGLREFRQLTPGSRLHFPPLRE